MTSSSEFRWTLGVTTAALFTALAWMQWQGSVGMEGLENASPPPPPSAASSTPSTSYSQADFRRQLQQINTVLSTSLQSHPKAQAEFAKLARYVSNCPVIYLNTSTIPNFESMKASLQQNLQTALVELKKAEQVKVDKNVCLVVLAKRVIKHLYLKKQSSQSVLAVFADGDIQTIRFHAKNTDDILVPIVKRHPCPVPLPE